ncbi:MAG: restriction endonuclease subunit S [Ignavibacteriaceae bacterium]
MKTKIMKFNIDKSNWSKFRFGDVAIQQKESVDRETTELKRYIAGEHMGSEDLHLRTWGEINGDYLGPAFHRKFEKGDILYGSRRTYLRKVAVAHFSGITANTTFVIKANEKYVLKELLPFIMLSENFAQHSIKNSKGSVNPYINWKDIANYEFLLPPKDQQTKIAELLWAADAMIEANLMLRNEIQQFRLSNLEAMLSGQKRSLKTSENEPKKETKFGRLPVTWGIYELEEILVEVKLGGNYPNSENESGVPLIKMGNLGRGKIVLDKVQRIPSDIEFSKDDILKKDDLLFNTRNTLELVGKVAIWREELPIALYNSNIMKMTFNQSKVYSNQFMNLIFNSRRGISQFRSFATGTTSVAAIYAPELKRFKIPLPTIEEQKNIVGEIEFIDDAILGINNNIQNSKLLLKKLVNQIF